MVRAFAFDLSGRAGADRLQAERGRILIDISTTCGRSVASPVGFSLSKTHSFTVAAHSQAANGASKLIEEFHEEGNVD